MAKLIVVTAQRDYDYKRRTHKKGTTFVADESLVSDDIKAGKLVKKSAKSEGQ